MRPRLFLFSAALSLSAPSVLAHAPSTAYVSLARHASGLSIEVKLDLRDVASILPVDRNDDGQVTWSELKIAKPFLEKYVASRFALVGTDGPCALTPKDLQVEALSSSTYAVVSTTSTCAGGAGTSLTYNLLFDTDAQHRAILKIDHSPAGVFTATARQRALTVGTRPWAVVFREFVVHGVFHIWEGLDHMLFLITLLIPAVFYRQKRALIPHDSLGRSFAETLKIVSAFTVAHSVTLILVTLGVVSLPSRLVESLIAASIIVTAVNNVWPLVGDKSWMIAGGFGLIHGFGFASVLGDLGLTRDTLLPSLLAFNVGVELGQAALVAVALPLCFAARKAPLYQGPFLKIGSSVAAGVAAVWMAERLFEFKVLPF